MNEKAGAAIVFPDHHELSMSLRLPDGTSIFTAEACALLMALRKIKTLAETSEATDGVIFSDSLSCLQALKNLQFQNRYIRMAADRIDTMSRKGIRVSI